MPEILPKFIKFPTRAAVFLVLLCLILAACGETPQPTRTDEHMDDYLPKMVEPEVFITKDGGISWQSSFKGPEKGKDFLALDCPDPNTCYVVMAESRFFVTTDQGATWTERKALSSFTGAESSRLSCPNITTCYLMSDSLVYRTTDGGANWVPSNPVELTKFPNTANFRAIDCPDAKICLVGNLTGIIVATNDGGTSWQRVWFAPDYHFSSIVCTSLSTCLVVGDNAGTGVTLVTNDSGKTWQVNRVSPTQDLDGLACPKSDACYTIGKNKPKDDASLGVNFLYTSKDGGNNWSQVNSSEQKVGTRLSCPAEQKCLAPGYQIIHTTDDAGLHWTDSAIGEKRELGDIKCVSAQVCFVLASSKLYNSSK